MTVTNALGWTLIHSLWEIAALAGLLSLSTVLWRKASPQKRYGIALVALLACLAAPLATYRVLTSQAVETSAIVGATVSSQVPSSARRQQAPTVAASAEQLSTWEVARDEVDGVLPGVVSLWLIGLVLMSLRLVGGIVGIERLKKKATTLAEPQLQALVRSLADRLGVKRPVTLRMCDVVESPVVVGVLRSVVLLPASAITKLSPQQVEALLAHEVAHIRRYDYLANMIQSVVETTLFFHPGVWWISSVVRTEREHCCDDMAIRVIGDKAVYARALVGLEELRHVTPRLALGATGGSLVDRIRRIHGSPRPPRVTASVWLTVVLTLTMAGVLARNLRAQSDPEASMVAVRFTVLRSDGKPAAGAAISWAYIEAGTAMPSYHESSSDRNGTLSVQVPVKGYLQVAAYQKGQGLASVLKEDRKEIILRLGHGKPVRVRVLTPTGTPIPNVKVGPQFVMNGRVGAIVADFLRNLSTTTDARGIATITDLPASGSAFIVADDDRYANGSYVRLPAEKAETKIVVYPSSTVEGTVMADGAPVPGAQIQILPTSAFFPGIRTDSAGRFSAHRLMRGSAAIICLLPKEVAKEWAAPAKNVTITPNSTQNVLIELTHGAVVKGMVIDKQGQSMSAPRVSIGSTRVPMFSSTVPVDSTGRFEVRVAAGEYLVSVFHLRGRSSKSQTIKVRDGETLDLTLHSEPDPAYSDVRVRVRDADGKPVPNLAVMYWYKPKGAQSEQGSVVVTDTSGETSVEIAATDVPTLHVDTNRGNQFSDPAVRPTNGFLDVNLHRVKLASVSGTVTDAKGRPLPGTTVSLGISGTSFVGDMIKMGPWEKKTDSRGQYRWDGLYPGIHIVVMVHSKSVADAQSSGITTRAGAIHRLQDIKVAPGTFLAGRVVDQNGKPIAKAKIFPTNVIRVKDFSVLTDANGRFRFDRMPFGKVRLDIYRGFNETHLSTEAGTDKQYTLVIKRPYKP